MMSLMQDLSGWVLAGRHADAAAALGRWSEIQPAFAPWAAGASAIAALPSPDKTRRDGFLNLLTSREFHPALAAPSPAEIQPLTMAFRMEGSRGLLAADQSLFQLAEGVAGWETGVARAVLQGVIDAGGLGDLALAIEKTNGGLAGRDYARAKAKLHDLTRTFRARYETDVDRFLGVDPSGYGMLARLEQITAGARTYLTGGDAAAHARDLLLFAGFRAFLDAELEASHAGVLLTDLLNGASATVASKREFTGSCLPTAVLAAHVLTAAGVKTEALDHNCSHVTVAVKGTPLVGGTTANAAIFRTLGEWRELGLVGSGQAPRPLISLLGNVTSNAANSRYLRDKDADRVCRGWESALRLFPEHFSTLVNQAYAHRDDAIRIGRLAARIGQLDPKSPWLHYFAGYALKAQGKTGDAIEVFSRFIAMGDRDNRTKLEDGEVVWISDRHWMGAIDEFVRLCVDAGRSGRAYGPLGRLANGHASPAVREHAHMILFLLQNPPTSRA